MKLYESYSALYETSVAFNELAAETEQVHERFSDLEDFLRQNSNEIEKLGLKADIIRLFQRNDFSKSSIENLFRSRQDEKKRQKTIIKWIALVFLMIILTIVSFGVLLIVAGVVFYNKPTLRKKTWDVVKSDWALISKKSR